MKRLIMALVLLVPAAALGLMRGGKECSRKGAECKLVDGKRGHCDENHMCAVHNCVGLKNHHPCMKIFKNGAQHYGTCEQGHCKLQRARAN